MRVDKHGDRHRRGGSCLGAPLQQLQGGLEVSLGAIKVLLFQAHGGQHGVSICSREGQTREQALILHGCKRPDGATTNGCLTSLTVA